MLPIVLGDRAKEWAWGRGEKSKKKGRFFPEGMPSAPAILCNYCRDPHARRAVTIATGGQARSQPPGPPGGGHPVTSIIRPAHTHGSGKWWRTPLRWLSKLVPTARITKRRRTFRSATAGRMELSTSSSSPSTSSEIGGGLGGAMAGQRRAETNGTDDGGELQGPSIDRWPRERDLAWEKWYLEQAPSGV